ncbi:enoyl-CoA hydratase-related protein [Embleya scabrispora]|uniref:enoyl-CoA hydratase-related protein n=1 Tax=Embleya scabrispora TaxID=159449 RepID=UPI00039C6725|nr:enoyl-CoA hydratase-related protein [Embleya scabrispora]MYS80949.1 enoyl-CoA hydratase/isomerase family protein [Streptomyces sp. SID5474]
MPELRHEDTVFVLDLGDDENRFAPDWLKSVHALLDTVVAHPEPAVLVTTGEGKFYSNGLDLDWLAEHGDQMVPYVADVEDLLARMLTLPVPTIAAVNGHAFGAGAMFAIAHDFRIMRADRGYFCFPEVDIRIPFSPGMAALVQAKLTPAAAVASMTTGQRFGGVRAQEVGLVDDVADEAGLVEAATARIRPLAGKDRTTLGVIKSTMYAAAAAALTTR